MALDAAGVTGEFCMSARGIRIMCATAFLAGSLVTAVIAVVAITAVTTAAAAARSIARASGFGGVGLNLCFGFKPGFLRLKVLPYLFH